MAGRVTTLKPEASKPLPLDPDLATALLSWRTKAMHAAGNDFVFAGRSGKPRWQGMILKRHLRRAANEGQIGKVGHTMRHTYSTLLYAHAAPMAAQKELLRHSDISTTMNIYTQALSDDKRQAASAVMDAVLGRNRQRVPVCTR